MSGEMMDKLSPSKAETWFTLDQYMPTIFRAGTVSNEHKKKLDMFDVWLERLKENIETFEKEKE